MDREKQNILVQQFTEDLLKDNPHIKKDDIRVITSDDGPPKIELKANIFNTSHVGGVKYPKDWHYEYDRGFIYSDDIDMFNVRVEQKPLETLRHPIDIVYELQRLNPSHKFGYDPASHEIISDVSMDTLNIDELKNRGGKLENGRLYFPNVLVNGEVVEVGIRKEYNIGKDVRDVMNTVRGVSNMMSGAKTTGQEESATIKMDGSTNNPHAVAVGNSRESNVVNEESAITDNSYFQRLKDAIENYEYRTTGGNDGTEKEAVAFDVRTGEKVYDDRINNEYNEAKKWMMIVCSYRGISITQDDWKNPDIKSQRIREIFDDEMRNVFMAYTEAKETLRLYYEDRPLERVLDILDKIANEKNRHMVTDLVAKYIQERDSNLYNAFMSMQKDRELGPEKEEDFVMEMKKKD